MRKMMEGVQMQQNTDQNKKDILNITRKMGRLAGELECLIANIVALMQELQETANMLEQVALDAEAAGDTDTLRTICYQLIPMFDELNDTYGKVCNVLDVAVKQQKIGERLEEQERKIGESFPRLVHVVADITANTGDYILGRCTRKLVEQECDTVIDWDIRNFIKKVDEEYITCCNQSNGMIIGGGGLFLKDTNPNSVSGWSWPCSVENLAEIQVPIYVLGVGYNRFRGQEEFAPCFTDTVNMLVEQSKFFGLRNHGSIRAIQSYLREDLREKVKFHPCATTVLSKLCTLPKRSEEEPYIAVNCAFDRANLRYGDKLERVMFAITRVLQNLSKDYKIKCYVQCSGDEQIGLFLDQLGVEYEIVTLTKALSEEEYLRYFTEPELMLATRGHAQMIPFGCKTPVVSMISHDKLAWFLEDIEHPEWGIEMKDEQFEQKLLEKSRYMLTHRDEICGQIEDAQDRLWKIMQENLKCIEL